MSKTEISTSKTKLFLMLLGCICFIILGYFLFTNPEGFISHRYRNFGVIKIVGLIAMLFSSTVFFYIPKKLLDKKPGLIIDDKGIHDNSSSISAGFVAWKEINSIKSIKVKYTEFLLIYVDNPKKHINGFNKIKQIMLSINNRIYGTPISISSIGLKINFKNLEELIAEKFEQYKDSNLK